MRRKNKEVTCKKCGCSFTPEPDQVWWDEHGYGYSTKLCRCKECNTIVVIEYIEDIFFK